MTPSIETLKEFIRMLGERCTSIEFKPRIYSGRGMYGKECLGIVTQDPLILMFELGELSYETKSQYDAIDRVPDIFDACSSNICQDSMGRSSVVYFPSVVLTFAEHLSVFEEFENGH